MLAIITALKSYKNIALVILISCLLTCAIYFAWRVTNLKAIYAQEKIDILTAQNDLHTENMKAIDSMIAEQKKNRLITSQISEQIQSLKEGKTHDEEYYKIANSIADRFNSSL